jgi:hypothetical protein
MRTLLLALLSGCTISITELPADPRARPAHDGTPHGTLVDGTTPLVLGGQEGEPWMLGGQEGEPVTRGDEPAAPAPPGTDADSRGQEPEVDDFSSTPDPGVDGVDPQDTGDTGDTGD